MGVHEECGVFGVFSDRPVDAAGLCYYGLYALQHRGQESCGIVVNDDGVFFSHKDLGLVNEVFTNDILGSFPKGEMAAAHVRYGTTGGTSRVNCQPVEVCHQKGHMALAHNGNITNAAELRTQLELSGAIFHMTSDTELIAYVITRERLAASSAEEALGRAMDILEGAYSLVVMTSQKMMLCRDPYGFRPLCYGRTSDGIYVAASESCALKAVGAEFIRDVMPGEILVFGKNGITSITDHCGTAGKSLCIFEYIYFARPDSVIDGASVHSARVRAGMMLAKAHPAGADIVIGVPDSGLDSALGFSMASGIPYGIGLTKNKYIGRTFISPSGRLEQVRIKLSVIEEEVRGRSVVLVDDSLVRGTTGKQLVRLLREAGAEKVHMRISSPPFLHPCCYGTDVDSVDSLIAEGLTIPEIAARTGADSLGYLPAESLGCLAGGNGYCDACFSGIYPTSVPEDMGRNRFETKLSEKEL